MNFSFFLIITSISEHVYLINKINIFYGIKMKEMSQSHDFNINYYKLLMGVPETI
jgi:hypothetical protein